MRPVASAGLPVELPPTEGLDLKPKGSSPLGAATEWATVVGEDGKAGMRGRLVSKQGQVLANALLAGIGAGIGQAFQQSATTVSTNPLGSIGTVDPGKQFQAGVGTGVGKALDRLSQYYITLAEKMFPIIEVDAGRTVDVVFTKGFSLDTDSAGGEPDTYTDIWRRGREVQKKSIEPYKE